MAYGVGGGEGRAGGAGRMGIWEDHDGKKRVIKFNTHRLERAFGNSLSSDPRMVESSNQLRQELLHIAEKAGISDLREIRARLGLAPESRTMETGTLLNRVDMAAVVTMIGGDDVWTDALRGERAVVKHAANGILDTVCSGAEFAFWRGVSDTRQFGRAWTIDAGREGVV